MLLVEFAIRGASSDDLDALVELRCENGRAHLALDSVRHRVPHVEDVRSHFRSVLGQTESARGEHQILIAELDGLVVGMTELIVAPNPPRHQIAAERRTAQIHTIVRPEQRGGGVGQALMEAAERLAAETAIDELVAPILLANERAASFYERNGFAVFGQLFGKRCGPRSSLATPSA